MGKKCKDIYRIETHINPTQIQQKSSKTQRIKAEIHIKQQKTRNYC